jgi:1,4-alpha-glucan branching enzyme
MNYTFGPLPGDAGTLFRLWAPSQQEVGLLLENRDAIAMQKNTTGFWQAHVDSVSSGARYRFGVDGYEFPDPASREQETDADGWSIVRGASGRPPTLVRSVLGTRQFYVRCTLARSHRMAPSRA